MIIIKKAVTKHLLRNSFCVLLKLLKIVIFHVIVDFLNRIKENADGFIMVERVNNECAVF